MFDNNRIVYTEEDIPGLQSAMYDSIINGNDDDINIERILSNYNESCKTAREIVNEIFISLTGYQLTTLFEMYKTN